MRTNLALILAVSILLSACSMEGVEAPLSTDDLVDEVIAFSSDYQRAAYSLLSPNEKREAWLRHIAAFQREGSWSAGQHSVIAQLRQIIAAPSWLAMDVAETEEMWLAKAEKVFSPADIFMLAYSLGQSTPSLPLNQNSDRPTPSCSCSMTARHTCGRIVGWPLVEYGVCDNDLFVDCALTDYGCGFLFLDSCDGSVCRY